MANIQEFIEKYNLVVDKLKSSDNFLYIRSSINSENEARSFIKTIEQRTGISWKVTASRCPKRAVFHKLWVCGHSSDKSPGNKEKCDARLDILIKKINPNTTKKDIFLLKKPPLPCMIRVYFKHNHDCENIAFNIKYSKVPEEVKKIFYGYFHDGNGPTKALKLHEQLLQRVDVPSDLFIPTQKQALGLYRLWYEQRRHIRRSKNGVNIEQFESFNWEEFINAIPQECLSVIDETKIRPDFQIKSALKNQNSGIKKFIPVTNSNTFPKMNNPVTTATIDTSSESSTLPIVYFLGVPVSTQHIENSSNHLNGSVLTIMNSDTLLTSSPNLVRNSISPPLTPVSSIEGTECLSTKTSNHSQLYSFKDNSLESKSNPKTNSKAPMYISETAKSKSSYLHQSKVLELSNTDAISHYILPKVLRSDSELNSLNSSNQIDNLFNKKSCLFGTKQCIDLVNQITPSVFKTAENFMLLNPNSIINSTVSPVAEKSDYLNSQSSLSNFLNKPKDSFSPSSAVLPSNIECSKTSTNSQIHITNTVHQSGAQISMVSSSQLNQDSFVTPLHIPEFFANQSFSDEHIKIKEEPPDLLQEQNFEESEYSDFSPTIINVASLNTDPEKEEIISVLSIKKEKLENDAEENESSVQLSTNVYLNPGEDDDEDKQFLLSLLPELKQLPVFIKSKLKREIQNLVSSFKISEICRKKRKL